MQGFPYGKMKNTKSCRELGRFCFLSFADIKSTTYEMARMAVIRKLVRLYSEHRVLERLRMLE